MAAAEIVKKVAAAELYVLLALMSLQSGAANLLASAHIQTAAPARSQQYCLLFKASSMLTFCSFGHWSKTSFCVDAAAAHLLAQTHRLIAAATD